MLCAVYSTPAHEYEPPMIISPDMDPLEVVEQSGRDYEPSTYVQDDPEHLRDPILVRTRPPPVITSCSLFTRELSGKFSGTLNGVSLSNVPFSLVILRLFSTSIFLNDIVTLHREGLFGLTEWGMLLHFMLLISQHSGMTVCNGND